MKAPRLSHSGIEYLDLAWGIYSGCDNWRNGICGGGGKDFNCWAMPIVKRFKSHYPNGFDPTWYPEAMLSSLSVKKPSIIGVGWVGDMFGDWVDPGQRMSLPLPDEIWRYGSFTLQGTLRQVLFGVLNNCPQHRFVFLTKCYWNLKRWSPFPKNAWVGVTITDGSKLREVLYALAEIEAGLIWLSVEPMLGPVVPPVWRAEWDMVGWVTVGAATRPYRPPQVDWVEQLVYECVAARKPVFLKDNLVKSLPPTVPFYVPPKEIPAKGKIEMVYRQEMPDW